MALQDPGQRRFNIPQPHGIIVAPRDNECSIRANRDRLDTIGMTRKHAVVSASWQRPGAARVVVASTDNEFVVGAICERADI